MTDQTVDPAELLTELRATFDGIRAEHPDVDVAYRRVVDLLASDPTADILGGLAYAALFEAVERAAGEPVDEAGRGALRDLVVAAIFARRPA
jgi:hypothetical protein